MLDVAASARQLSSRSALGWGAGALSLGALLALLAMLAKPVSLEQRWLEMVVGGSGVLLASAGALAVIAGMPGARRSPAGAVALSARAFVPGLSVGAGAFALLTILINRAVVGVLPAAPLVLGLAVPALCLGMVWGLYACARQLAASSGPSEPRPVPAELWVAGLGVLLYMPTLGSFGLLDCWEPHYSEVAREMLARHDWISLWWGDQSWFWSKPILNFWLEGLSYSWFGLEPRPEGILSGVAAGLAPAPEWAARLPIATFAIAGALVLVRGVGACFGRRAALCSGLILLSCPYWFFLARQTMVDMAYAAPLAATLGFFLLADASGDAEARAYRVALGRRSLALSGYHLLFFALAGVALAQIFYLVSRHVSFELGDGFGLHFHRDSIWTGSPGNCTLPGNEACRLDVQATSTPLQPGLSALAWAACLGTLLWRERNERRLRALYQLAAWACVALSVMAKGAPGLVLPLCTFGAWLALGGRLSALREAKLPALGLILACVAAPWFVQEYARHGAPFFERLFLHDMVNRAFGHVHDTNAGVDTGFRYYLWQLGYGLFPWSGVATAGVLFCVGKSSQRGTGERFTSGTQLLSAWLLACFGMFSIAGTKFHHYILPLVPAAAVFGGVLFDELWRLDRSRRVLGLGLLALVPSVLVAVDLARPGAMPGAANLLHLFIYKYDRPWPPELQYGAVFIAAGCAAALGCLLLEAPRLRRAAIVLLSGSSVVFAVWCLDVYLLEIAPHWSQRGTVGAYYRARRGPDQLLVAYRQNWMGENFYTGNHVATFKSGGEAFKRWIAERRRDGKNVLFFTTEHATVSLLKRELGSIGRFDLLTTPAQNNKFVLARVEL